MVNMSLFTWLRHRTGTTFTWAEDGNKGVTTRAQRVAATNKTAKCRVGCEVNWLHPCDHAAYATTICVGIIPTHQ